MFSFLVNLLGIPNINTINVRLKTQHVIDFGENVWSRVSPFVPQMLLDALGIFVVRILFWYSDLSKERYQIENTHLCIPDAPLRYRVWGDTDIGSFLWSGEHCSKDIRRALAMIGRDVQSFHNILDFGSGCGRIFMFLENDLKLSHFQATDIDKDAIAWCSANYNYKFSVNNHNPPLDYSSKEFDLILAIAVFRHFNEDHQFAWMKELKRILKPGGILLASVHGSFCWNKFPEEETEVLNKRGFLHKSLKDPYFKSVYPEWYQATYHSEAYIQKQYSKYFKILEYIPQGIENETDLIVMQKT